MLYWYTPHATQFFHFVRRRLDPVRYRFLAGWRKRRPAKASVSLGSVFNMLLVFIKLLFRFLALLFGLVKFGFGRRHFAPCSQVIGC